MTSIQNQDGAGNSIGDYTYTYDLARQLVSEGDNGTTTDYAYDATGQLTGPGSNTYNYEANGNPANSGDVIGPDNELLSDGTWTYTYDADGNEIEMFNLVTGVTWHYGYDAAGAMISAVEDSAGGAPLVEVSYTYDVFGNRLEQDVWQAPPGTSSPGTTTTTRYAYDGWNPAKAGAIGTSNFDIWATLDGSGSLTTRYVDGDAVDQVFARVDQNGAAWLYTDHLGSVRAVTDGSGALLVEANYDALGNVTSLSGPNQSALGSYEWTGQVFDSATGFYEMRARQYDPGTGRWLSQDPLGFDAGDSNLYRYVNNQPTDKTDPSGMADCPDQPPEQPGTPPIRPNDNPKAGHVFISIVEESKKYNIYKKAGDPNAKLLTIDLTPPGKSPLVTRTNPDKLSKVPQQEGVINENPWRGLGGPGAKTGQVVAGKHVTIEWVLTFSGDPRKCDWGRNICTDFTVNKDGTKTITFRPGKRDNVLRYDYPDGDTFIIGNKVVMYDAPGGPIRTFEAIFEIWVVDPDNKVKTYSYYHVNTATGSIEKIPPPTIKEVPNWWDKLWHGGAPTPNPVLVPNTIYSPGGKVPS